jgi:DNA-binding transcriptional ArsR family regulator
MNMMTEKKTAHPLLKEQSQIFKLLTHPTRLAILDILRPGEECVCHMEAILGLRQAYLSQQLSVLREAGIIQSRRDGWNIFYHVVQPHIYALIDAAGAMIEQDPNLPSERQTAAACPCPKCSTGNEVD